MNPTLEDLSKSEKFFIDLKLEDALKYFKTPQERFTTPTAKNDLERHCDNLVYAAQRLDKLPAGFWSSVNYNQPFLIPMQVIEWGKENASTPLSFTREATQMADLLVYDVQKSQDDLNYLRNQSQNFRDHSEQAYRILDVYTHLLKLLTE